MPVKIADAAGDADGCIGLDAPSVSNESEAFTLMVHHLSLAAMYFEATADPLPPFPLHFSEPAMAAWAETMEKLYPTD